MKIIPLTTKTERKYQRVRLEYKAKPNAKNFFALRAAYNELEGETCSLMKK